MQVTYGPSPFGDFSEYQKFKRASKKELKKNWGVSYPSSGWKKPAMRNLTDSKGNRIQVPEDDYQDYMTFYRSATDEQKSDQYTGSGRLRDVQTPADYIDYAFGKNTKVVPIVQQGVGHIQLLEYAPRHQVLRVTFTNNGSIVAFFRVPQQVAMVLMHLAQSGSARSDGKHLLGVYFWDMIRIRGTVHGSRYKFTYVQDHSTGGLPGRPYGSGEYIYREETGLDKGTQKQINALKEHQEIETALYDLISKDPELYADIQKGKTVQAADIQSMLDKYAADKKSIENSIAALEATGKQVHRRVPMEVAKDVVDPTDAMLAAWGVNRQMIDKLPATKQQQLAQVQQALANYITPERAAARVRQHNATRRIDRSWDNERVSELAEQVASKGVFGKGGIEYFNNHFPNASEQFDYLKHRGFIPADARYINE